LADTLSRRARHHLNKQPDDASACSVVLHIAQCLLDTASCLATNSGGVGHREDFLEAVRAVLQKIEDTGEHPTECVLEAEGCKRNALLGALDLAGVLLRLGGVLDFVNNTLG